MRQRTETLAGPQLRAHFKIDSKCGPSGSHCLAGLKAPALQSAVLAESQVADGRKGDEKHRPSDESEHAAEEFRLFKSEHQSVFR